MQAKTLMIITKYRQQQERQNHELLEFYTVIYRSSLHPNGELQVSDQET